MTDHRHVDPEAVLAGLKDFQRDTARWVFKRMFDDDDATSRFLVADEVGLGKTHVAKGVVAQVIDHLQTSGDRRHDIVYICSNSAIARQNLRKLVPAGITPLEGVERLTMLPTVELDTGASGSTSVNLLAITPGTSFRFGRRTGKFEERCLAYEFLRQLWGSSVMGAPARWIFSVGIVAGDPDQRLKDNAARYRNAVRRNLRRFEAVLADGDRQREARGDSTSREIFDELVDGFAWQKWFPERLNGPHAEFLAEIRRCMAIVGIEALQPDLVILDEFQRFKELLEPNPSDFATELAHRLFNHVEPDTGRRTRTLLLSATPYRMYSTEDETDSEHYADFLATCRFLFDDDDRVEGLRRDFTALRRSLTSADALTEAPATCDRISASLRSVMSRTERLAATPDRDGMLTERPTHLKVEPDDIAAYLRIGDISQAVGYHEPLEYWKSAPYLVNFMDHYKLKRDVVQAAESGLTPDLGASGPGLLPWTDVVKYAPIDPQNGRLRWLIDDLDHHKAFELLWIPPSKRYYDTGSVYESPEAGCFTKRLIFSGWAVVPKTIAALVSYEAERTIYRDRSHDYTASRRERGDGRLVLRTAERRTAERRAGEADTDRRAASMTTFALMWPSPSLARLGEHRTHGSERPMIQDVTAAVRALVNTAVARLVRRAPSTGAVDARWYWAAPILLDHEHDADVVDLLLNGSTSEPWGDESSEADGLLGHVAEARAMVDAGSRALGRPPGDLIEVLTEMALGSPAVCFLRSISAVTSLQVDDISSVAAAARVGAVFRRFFNAPETTAVVLGGTSLSDDEETAAAYWHEVLRHNIQGSLQALLDEHVHVLRDWLGVADLGDVSKQHRACTEIAASLYDALDLRTSTFDADIPVASSGDETVSFERHGMRTRFAVAYGQQRLDDQATARIGAVATAFNSPFWPFVLASTSVGQEGLDFHLWCHSVVHWNLPTNPVDLEQREGRVHRYKGHAVRRNIAASIEAMSENTAEDLWEQLFQEAVRRRPKSADEMVPFWVYPDGPYRIERLVPILPFSRDAAAFPRLRRSLAAYRLAFGQPRQDELVEFLGADRTDSELLELGQRLRIDLRPPSSGLG